ncbi:hypothetical protein [Paractinoplanes maris]|uniref:hypothetical protein n=1 Tax=Paractinoplanes maris TaxID=1734446 RepID=UPI00201FDBA9|nr:hypothetical protein [Actinoplanes maris]
MSRDDWVIGPEHDSAMTPGQTPGSDIFGDEPATLVGDVGYAVDRVTATHHDAISNFLADAINASSASNYPCLAVLIARTADAREVQQQLWEDHVSIDDLTGEHILVILPYKKPNVAVAADRPGVFIEDESVEIRAGTLTMPGGAPPEWAQEFWRARVRRLRRQGKLSDAQRRGTETARETRLFFGLPEQMLPCLALTMLREQEVRVLRLEKTTNLYHLLGDIVGEWEAAIDSEQDVQSFGAAVDRVANAQRYQPAELHSAIKMPQFPSWTVQVWHPAGLRPLRPLKPSHDRS